MMKRETTSSAVLARITAFPSFSEHSSARALELSVEGTFLGQCERSGMPFFLNPCGAVNPHIFIAGMSGSGKTYLTKNIMLKLFAVLGHQIVLLDFTGEYLEFSEFAACTKYDFSGMKHLLSGQEPLLLYVGLAEMKNTSRTSAALKIIGELTEIMRSRETRRGRMLFIILDEAWKLLLTDRSLMTLVREGRKYGTGIILASQLIEDMELGMLSNIATMFIFRMQNKSSLKKLWLNYQVKESDLAKMQNLEVGKCLVIQLRKSGMRDAFFLSRVLGISVGTAIKIKKGAKMVEIEYKKLESIITGLSKEDPSAFLSRLNAEKAIESHKLIAELMVLGADRLAILSKMRLIGLSDSDIADSFAMAIGEVSADA